MDRPEYIKCVVKEKSKETGVPSKSWCGRDLWSYEFAIRDIEIAELMIQQEQMLVPCPECMAAASKRVKEYHYQFMVVNETGKHLYVKDSKELEQMISNLTADESLTIYNIDMLSSVPMPTGWQPAGSPGIVDVFRRGVFKNE